MLLISKEGKLYNQDGTLYEEVQFSISMTDINRLTKICDSINRIYADGYDPDEYDEKFNKTKKNVALFVFGFSANNKTFNTSNKPDIVQTSRVNHWGADSIKLRVFFNRLNKQYVHFFENYLFDICDEKTGEALYTYSDTFIKGYKTYTLEY